MRRLYAPCAHAAPAVLTAALRLPELSGGSATRLEDFTPGLSGGSRTRFEDSALTLVAAGHPRG
jgi:hypothetical protein